MGLQKSRIFGILGVRAINSNFNGDMTGSPKKHMEDFVASDASMKYIIKKSWDSNGEKVFGLKSYVTKKGSKKEDQFAPRTLEERYEQIFGPIDKNDKSSVIRNLLTCVDLMNFGATFAVKSVNQKIAGVVQLNEAVNRYEDAEVVRDLLLSQFKNSGEGGADAEMTTMGNRTVLTEGHFFYSFSVNPLNLKEFIDANIGVEGYTEEAYQKFKSASLNAVTNFNTVSRAGCTNEFGMFVELKEGSDAMLGNLNHRVDFYKEGNMNVIDLSRIKTDLELIADEIDKIEVYYNPADTKIIIDSEILEGKMEKRYINRPKKLIG